MDKRVTVAGLILTIYLMAQVNAFDIEITPSEDLYAVKYNLVYFLCKVVNAGRSAPITVSWAVNGKRVDGPPPYKFKWKYGGILMIRPLFVGRTDGFYECVATDRLGRIKRKGFSVTVKEEEDLPAGFPKITLHPDYAYLTEGDTAILPCKANGNPPPKIRWFQTHVPIEFPHPEMKLLPDNSLQIANVTYKSRGLFECEVSNSVGRRMSQRAGIYVKQKKIIKISPTLTYTQHDITVDPESFHVLKCEATGRPDPVFSWYRNGRLQGGGTEGIFHLTYVLESANFTCQARNGAEHTDESTAVVTMRPKPLTPSAPKQVNFTTSSITITWSPNSMEKNPITGYFIKYRVMDTPGWNETFIKAPKMHFTYGGLRPYTFCEFQVTAYNSHGRSRPGKIDYYVSGEAVPETPAINLFGVGYSDDSFNATWDDPLIPNGRIRRYRVYYTVDKKEPLSDWSIAYAGLNWMIIRRLERHQVYYFKIQVVGYAGLGPMSTEVAVVKAQAGAPSQVRNVRVDAVGARNISLSWNDPIYHGNGLDGYEIEYIVNDFPVKEPVEFGHRSAVMNRLFPYSLYSIRVRAKSFSGTGPASEPVEATTLEDKPSGRPQGSRARPRSSTSIEVFWQPPLKEDRNGKITGYSIMYTPIRSAPPKILTVDGSHTSAMLTGLRKFTKYTIWVSSKNSRGEGPPSNKFEIYTHEDVPEGAPRDVRVKVLNDSAISVRWREPIEKSGTLRGYFVYYLHVKDSHEYYPHKTLPTFINIGDPDKRHQIVTKEVEPSRTYRVTVAAYTFKGDGRRSSPIYVKTPKRLPPAPVIRPPVMINLPATADIKLSWRPNVPGVLRYKIVYGRALSKLDNLADVRSSFVAVSSRTKVFKGLEFGIWYCFKVSQETAVDWSSESQMWFKTPEGKPKGVPLNLRVVIASPTTIELKWAPPDPWLRQGAITKYAVHYKVLPGGRVKHTYVRISPNGRFDATLVGLKPSTRYSFRVAAYTKVGMGPLTTAVTGQTDDEELPVVKSIVIEDVTSNAALVKWDPIQTRATTGYKVIGYKVTVIGSRSYKDNTKTSKAISSFNEQMTTHPNASAYFDDLKPFLFYTVSVRMEASSGTGERNVSHFRTLSSAPPRAEPPRGIQVVKNSMISVVLSPSTEINGPVDFYHLCVIDYGRSSQSTKSGNTGDSRRRRSLARGQTYVTAELKSVDLPRTVTVGDGSEIGGYENKKLTDGHSYRLFVRAYVRQGSKYVNSTSALSETVAIPLKATPVNEEHKYSPGQAKTSGGSGVVIAAAVIGVLFGILIVAVIIFIVRRRRRRSQDPDDDTSKTFLRGKNGSVINGEKPKDLIELHRIAHPTNGMMSHPPISVDNFAEHLNSLKANEYDKFLQEFKSINPGEKFVSEESNQPYNKYKNRYHSVLAYDCTRVVLSSTDEPGSDYFNGNFIDGYCTKKEYIATQGPLPNTVADFWRACWEYNCGTIVMMTKLEERGRSKCEQYWPSSGMAIYGKIQVTKLDEIELANFTKRTFEISEDDVSGSRIVKQFQFTAWPDPDVPKNPGPLLTFVKRVRKENVNTAGPMIVHCSAGVGKTGCFIALDSVLQRINYDHTVDIYGYVTMMRSQRNYMIQNDEQYVFLHDAVMDAIASGSTEVNANNLFQHFKKLTDLNGKGVEYLEDDFRVLVNGTVPDANISTVAHQPTNKQQNRCQTIVPYDSNRVCLQQIRGSDSPDYVNASHIDGYKERRAYIAAQGPMEDQTEEFWRMVMECNCSIIVMLTNLEEKGKEMCYKYWPSEKSERYYYYVVEPVNETRHPHFCVRELKVTDARDGEARTIRQFQYANWPKNGVPLASEGIIELIGQVNKSKQQLNNSGPILCHSNTGAGRSGVFIALSIVLERLQVEGVIDIHRTVKTLRLERPFLVKTVDQYRFCFQVAVDFLRNFEMTACYGALVT